MSTTNMRSAVRLGGRIGIGVIAVAVAAGGVVAAAALQTPKITPGNAVVSGNATVGDTSLVCGDSVLALGRDSTHAQSLSVAGTLQMALVQNGKIAASDLPVAETKGALTKHLQVGAVDGSPGRLAGTGSVRLSAPDLTGFAVSSCRPASAESWLVGLDGRTGVRGIITLANPTAVVSTVTLTAYGSSGPSTSPLDISIAPGTTKAVPVSAVAGAEISPVIRLQAVGAPVQASVQTGVLRGLAPAGIDVQDVVPSVGLRQVIPGLTVVRQVKDVPATAVRVLAPSAPGTATVEVVRAGDAGKAVYSTEVKLTAGIPMNIDVPSLPKGEYVVVVSGTSDLVAAASQVTGVKAGDDIAWYPAVPELRGQGDFAVATGAAARVLVFNAGAKPADVTAVLNDGEQSVPLAPGEARMLDTTSGGLQSVSTGATDVFATVVYSDEKSIASSGIWPVDAASEPVRVTR